MNMEEANKLVGAGKNQLVMGKVVEAVSTLQEACGILAKAYGDTADECAEAFFWCGRALLDLARMENSVLGNALEGVPEGDEDEKPQESNVEGTENVDEKTRDELRVQVYDAMAEKPEDAKKKAEGDKKLEESDREGTTTTTTTTNCIAERMSKINMNVLQESNEEEEEEVGNLQLAAEMLEVAKVIYKRKELKEDQLMAAQAHLRLGEVSVESGNYTQALEDFQECLSLQLKHLDADSRLLAETHYQLGLTFTLNQQYKEAIDELNRSVSVIKSRLENLTELIAKAAGPEALSEERQEMEELKALLPDIQEKVEDATAMKAVLVGRFSTCGSLKIFGLTVSLLVVMRLSGWCLHFVCCTEW
uniref:Tetratricopeptide SHNi-TPR domain-containing protein n=1 Tax=Hippocampus comes TaxID=109280 RepID=A0A3Q3DSM2_HIPCM